MLGLAQAAHLSDKLPPLAAAVADWYLANVPADRVRAWEFHPAAPDAPKGTSATAIATAALVKLAPRNELIWGDYFALEAALGLRGTLATATL